MIDMKQVMDLNEYEKRKEVRVKSQLYFKAITKVMEEKNRKQQVIEEKITDHF